MIVIRGVRPAIEEFAGERGGGSRLIKQAAVKLQKCNETNEVDVLTIK